jgi:hypothetical protein
MYSACANKVPAAFPSKFVADYGITSKRPTIFVIHLSQANTFHAKKNRPCNRPVFFIVNFREEVSKIRRK